MKSQSIFFFLKRKQGVISLSLTWKPTNEANTAVQRNIKVTVCALGIAVTDLDLSESLFSWTWRGKRVQVCDINKAALSGPVSGGRNMLMKSN